MRFYFLYFLLFVFLFLINYFIRVCYFYIFFSDLCCNFYENYGDDGYFLVSYNNYNYFDVL